MRPTLRSRARRRWKGLTASVIVVLALLVVGVPYLYIHAIEGNQPAPLTLAGTSPSATSSAGTATSTKGGGQAVSIDGAWKVASGSQAGYRVHETLAGQSTTAVGRTTAVTGSMTISSRTVSAATFTVQMAQVTSDRSQRDEQFAGRIMDTSQYPTGTFTLTEPIDLGSVPAIGKVVTVHATGNLTLHGTTKSVTFTMLAKRSSSGIAINGDIPILYGDYNIDNPSFGGFVSVGTSGTIEFLLDTTKT